VDELQRDVDIYFGLVEPVLGWDADTRRAQGADYLRTQIFPRRQQLLQISDRIREMDTRSSSLRAKARWPRCSPVFGAKW
jgi:hypothetical protein